MVPICLVQDPIPSNLGELTKWILVLLQILSSLEGQTFREKWGETTCQELSVRNKTGNRSQISNMEFVYGYFEYVNYFQQRVGVLLVKIAEILVP